MLFVFILVKVRTAQGFERNALHEISVTGATAPASRSHRRRTGTDSCPKAAPGVPLATYSIPQRLAGTKYEVPIREPWPRSGPELRESWLGGWAGRAFALLAEAPLAAVRPRDPSPDNSRSGRTGRSRHIPRHGPQVSTSSRSRRMSSGTACRAILVVPSLSPMR
jgi:hypothetical protein